MNVLGIDIGGSAVKGALVDTETGLLTSERARLACPELPKPKDIAERVAKIASNYAYRGVIGAGFPAVVRNGVAYTASNIHSSFINLDVASLLRESTGCPVAVVNDADAAGIAEMRFGAGKGEQGMVLILTLGTGIGSAIFIKGVLLPNTEFGHFKIRGKDAEKRASAAVRDRKRLSWKAWSRCLQEVLADLEIIFTPDLIIIGGGISKDFDLFAPNLKTRAKIVPARFLNQAGIVGAACYAAAANMKDVAAG